MQNVYEQYIKEKENSKLLIDKIEHLSAQLREQEIEFLEKLKDNE
jgi:hypothetical protein